MATTRKNRQTGTMITVGSGAELGLNDGEGWLTICDDHSWIVSHSTRKLAYHHASDPLGWCEVCSGAATVGEDGIVITDWEASTALTDFKPRPDIAAQNQAAWAATPEPEYPTLYIDTLQAEASVLRRNERRPEGDYGRCLICEAPIQNPANAKEVHLCKGGIAITMLDAPYDDPGDMGIFLIGPECYRKHKAVLAPYVMEATDG